MKVLIIERPLSPPSSFRINNGIIKNPDNLFEGFVDQPVDYGIDPGNPKNVEFFETCLSNAERIYEVDCLHTLDKLTRTK